MKRYIYPDKAAPGDRIAIISPATTVKEEYVRGAADFLSRKGYEAVIMPSALGPASGSFAATHEARVKDLRMALSNPLVKVILCARGGYGCVHLLPAVAPAEVSANPKWMIGFSDVSALHALWHTAGVASLHAPMAKHLTLEPEDDFSTLSLLRIISGDPTMDYTIPSHPANRMGTGEGILRGGNLAVLNGLASTPYDLLAAADSEPVVLFIEDISEAIYAVERMLMRLYLSGALSRLAGLVIGQFTEYRADRNFQTMEEMIAALLSRYGIGDIPVAFGFPVGHVKDNYPLIVGSRVRLSVAEDGVNLKTID